MCHPYFERNNIEMVKQREYQIRILYFLEEQESKQVYILVQQKLKKD